MLLSSGFLGVTITDLTRWRVLSPKFSPRLSARLINGFFAVHRGLALLTFTLITTFGTPELPKLDTVEVTNV